MTQLAPTDDPVVTAVRLALGSAAHHEDNHQWPRVLAVARAERLLALAWLRSGAFIRQHAPADVSAQWRADMVAADARARVQWATTVAVVRELSSLGVPVSVLKGVPLSLHLYGNIAARVCTDIDLLVPVERRTLASDMLRRSGWYRWTGEAPWDESYAHTVGTHQIFIELHSIVTGEALAHCRELTLETHELVFEGESVPVTSGEGLPAYLAANIAKHSPVPLLSFLDLATVWAGLSEAQRAASFRAARAARLHRYLHWALARGFALTAIDDRAEVLALVGIRGIERRAAHAFFRLTWLAATPSDAARVLGSWAWPRSTRASLARTRAFWWRRLRERMAGRFVYRRLYVPR